MTLPEFLYHIGYSIKKTHVLKHQKRLPGPVISIGNVTVGGTGKTPATIAVAEEAMKRGFSPIILTRGYRGKAEGPCFVKQSAVSSQQSDKKNKTNSLLITHHSSLLYGDEPVLMAERLKDVPVVKCADRYEGGIFAINSIAPSLHHSIIFILDDGFQHWRLHRDVDVVLVDGLNPFGNRRILPVGPLREPLSELKRAGIFVITKIKNEALADELKGINPDAPVYFSEYEIHRIRDKEGNEFQAEALRDKKVYAFCGIANPESFRQTVLSLSGEMSGFKAFRDHCKYTEADLMFLERQRKALNCDYLITTEKDMVKLRELKAPDDVLCIEIGFKVRAAFFEDVFRRIERPA